MPQPHLDIDAVTRLIAQVADEIVMPKFNALRADEIRRKPTPGHVDDIVTVVDRDAEAHLTESLRRLLPSACVIGEEAAHKDPALVALVNGDRPVWIIDPLDGTSNFARGHDGFGIMVSLAVCGRTRAAWVHLPARRESFVAEAGSGAFHNGVRLRVPAAERRTPRGALFTRYMPDEVRTQVLARTAGRIVATAHTGAAAVEYTGIARGLAEFAIYYRLLPWDHGAPALILSESGGRVEHLDGRAYTVRSADQITLVARDADMVSTLRAWLTSASPTPGTDRIA
jgi:fructose-1,6-bisphosphatase/inositol monophosphatase family enzyme